MKLNRIYLNRNEHKLFEFCVGTDELILIKELLRQAYQYTPRVIETTPTRGRLRQMWRVVGEALKNQKVTEETL